VGLVLPALQGKLDGTAIRVPTANVSPIDFTFDAARNTSREEINGLMEKAAGSSRLPGIIGINKPPMVSVDFDQDPHSAVFDVTQTQILDQHSPGMTTNAASQGACWRCRPFSAIVRERADTAGR
jgi:glyceraldehyde 3-phosphate dehydrogenase